MNNGNVMKRLILGTLFTSAFAYAVTLCAMVGFEKANAEEREVPSSDCHAKYDNVGTTLDNSGSLTYTGSGSIAIFCPMISQSGQSKSSVTHLYVYGYEGTNGSSSRACACALNPISCWCTTATSWTNNAGGISGRVATDVDTGAWSISPEQKFGYVLHYLTTSSSLAGLDMLFSG